ncbi:winged helix-turn-helix domain-containing tetratricopeptide repeat protein [Falsiroseomonas sp. HW251]|uniref:winged helix-turn-helix domain-containing tetratricopeptide repeat protein n=1 Tax=Falsiroseomonas sp. HW251 TaxID=3390998 RepID=UPI003D30F3C4
MRWHFAEFCLDTDRRELRRQGEPVRIEPQAFDLLEYLVLHRDRLVTRDDLIEGVWGGRIVSESALATCINAARVAIGDSGERQALIRTIPRKGLRFVGEAREEAAARPAPPEDGPLSLPDRPSIAVLPFRNLSGDPSKDHFVDGIVEGIITGLCRMRWLFVIARNSSFVYRGRAVDAKQVGRELGVRYLLEGSAQIASHRVRVHSQLVDAMTGALISADRFEGSLEDIFGLQDEVAAAVVGAVTPKLEEVEIERASRKPTDSLDAYETYLRGAAAIHVWTRESQEHALQLFQRAIAIDPGFAAAYGMAARCYGFLAANGWMADRDRSVPECLRLARRAVELGKDDAQALSAAGFAIARVGDDLETGADLLEQALAFNPNHGNAWMWSGWIRVWRAEPDEAISCFLRAMRLSPVDPEIFVVQAGIASAHLIADRYDDARVWAERALRAQPTYGPGLRVAAASLALTGRIGAAGQVMATIRAIDPALCLANLHDRANWSPDGLARMINGLRLAGLPE